MGTPDLPDLTLQKIFDHAAVGIAQIDLDGNFLRVNDRYCQMFGYSESELLLKTVRDINLPDNCTEVLAGCRQLQDGVISSHSMEKRYVRKDGTVFWGRLHRSLIRSGENVPQYFVAVVEDITETIQAERALRDAEHRLTLAQDAAHLGVWDRDLRTNIVAIRGKYAQIHGLSPDRLTITREEWLSLIHPEDLEKVQALRREARERTHTFDAEFRVIWPEGSVHWVRAKGTVLIDEWNRPVRSTGVIEDITQRKQHEATLRENERRLRANEVRLKDAQRLAKVGSWARELDTDKITWSEEIFRIFGVQDDALPDRQAFLSRVHPEDLTLVLEAGEKVRSSVVPVEVEYRIVRPDGEIRFVRSIAEAIRNDQGAAIRTVGATQDITDQKLNEERLRTSEAHLKNAQRLAKLGSWERDDITGSTEFSDEMLRILGMPDDPPRSLAQFLQYVHADDRELVRKGDLRARSTSAAVEGEYRIVRADSDVRYVRSVIEAIRDGRGAVIRVVGATQDVTDFKRAQEESAARQKLESIGTLANGIAHDFNNLLGAIEAQAELGLAESVTGVSCNDELKSIRDAAIRGAEIVRQLMIYAGKEKEVGGPVDLSKIVEEMLPLLKVTVSKRAAMNSELGQGLPPARATAAQLRQILLNLITNASDAIGDRDGVIRVITKYTTLRSESEIAEPASDGGHLVLEVSDTGCGMSSEIRARVFDPFFTTKSAGRGLGLAVVDGIVRGLGGTIQIASELGKGTTCQILLPCTEARCETTSDALSAIAEFAGAQRATVLMVEDEFSLRQALAKLLRNRGFKVFEAADGSSAIDLLRKNNSRIDVILLDATIPGASSAQVLTEAAQTRPDIKVILTSAYTEEMVTKSSSMSQICCFIRKPFQFEELVNTLRRATSAS